MKIRFLYNDKCLITEINFKFLGKYAKTCKRLYKVIDDSEVMNNSMPIRDKIHQFEEVCRFLFFFQ